MPTLQVLFPVEMSIYHIMCLCFAIIYYHNSLISVLMLIGTQSKHQTYDICDEIFKLLNFFFYVDVFQVAFIHTMAMMIIRVLHVIA